jgi:phage anti-repressor protein
MKNTKENLLYSNNLIKVLGNKKKYKKMRRKRMKMLSINETGTFISKSDK